MKSLRPSPHSTPMLALLLALLMLWAQAAAFAHGVSHGLGSADEPVCEQCLGFAPLGAGLTDSTAAWTAPEVSLPEAQSAPVLYLPSFTRTYRSRAPPRA